MKYIVCWHCHYHFGSPTYCGGLLGEYATIAESELAIRKAIDEDIAREIQRAECDNRLPDYSDFSYDGKLNEAGADCNGYSNIYNEEIFYYINELKGE